MTSRIAGCGSCFLSSTNDYLLAFIETRCKFVLEICKFLGRQPLTLGLGLGLGFDTLMSSFNSIFFILVTLGPFVLHAEIKTIYSNKFFQIQCQTTLKALVQTSRAFRDIFSPILHVRRIVYLNRCPVSGLAQKALPPGLLHARDLEIRVEDFSETRINYDVSMNIHLIAFVTRMIKDMPNIQSFR
jgi:hypothetical protein